MNRKKKNILSLTFGPIGDTLMLLAWFDDVLAIAPDARMTVIATRNAAQLRELALGYPQVSIIEPPKTVCGWGGFLGLAFSSPWRVFSPGVAGVYSFHLKFFFLALSLRPGNITVGMGALNGTRRWLPFQQVIPFDRSERVIDNFRKAIPILFPGAIAPLHAQPQVHLTTALPKNFAHAPGSYIVLHPLSLNPRRSLPPRRWPVLIQALRSRYPECKILVTGGRSDQEAIGQMLKGISGVEPQIGLSLLEVAGIIEQSALYIGVDTGITHLASVIGHPTVMIGNRSNPTWWPTYNKKALVLYNDTRCLCLGDKGTQCSVEEDGHTYYACIYDISDEQILSAVKEFLPHN